MTMKSRFFLLIALSMLLGTASCTSERRGVVEMPSERPTEVVPTNGVMTNLLRVKLSETYQARVGERSLRATDDGDWTTNVPELTECLKEIGAVEVRPLFPIDPKFEKRMRRAGLHLWYDIVLDESKANGAHTRALAEVKQLPGVEIVEQVPIYRQMDEEPLQFFGADLRAFDFNPVRPDQVAYPFNDPMLPKQWHYFNNGSGLKSVKGADLNLFEAWQKEVGKPNVIVAVIDGGVYYDHEDLKQNIWVNPKPGVTGEKYVGDIHGYNFADGNANIAFDAHGTHVAGVIAAVNNNGVGVSGIAGGNGSANSGVRVMVCDAFGAGGKGQAFEQAFVYAANHGAVISQNSWGGAKFLAPSLKAAIDYFIDYAGCDNDGNQLPDSPMKGGVVLFAAGNESSDDIVYPAAYNEVVAVAAMAPDWKKAYYTNRGEYVDITAPGGDLHYPGGQIYSTSVRVDKDESGNILQARSYYEFMQGTSMACPHVSGVTALIVSHFGGQGFTNTECKQQLLTALRPADIDAINPGFEGVLGKGYLDAARALDHDQKKAPKAISQLKIEPQYTAQTLCFSAVADEDDRTATYYYVYYDDEKVLNKENYKGAKSRRLFGLNYEPGDEIQALFKNLKLDHEYHYAIVAKDRWGNLSEPTFISGKTLLNHPPKIEVISQSQKRITGTEQSEIKVLLKDPESHKVTYSLSGNHTGVRIEEVSPTELILHLSARGAIGIHQFTLKVTDEFGASSTQEFSFEVYTNSAPVLSTPLPKTLFLTVGKPAIELDLSKYVVDPDGHKVTYQIASGANSEALKSQMNGAILTITPNKVGKGTVQLKAVDSQGADLYISINVRVVDSDIVYHVYPIPTYDVLHVLLNSKMRDVELSVVNGEGTKVLRQHVTNPTDKSLEARNIELNVQQLSGGVYTLVVKSGSESYYRKFVKY